VLTLTPREAVVLSCKGWIEGRARRGHKGIDGVRAVVLKHVVLVVAMTKVLTFLKRPSSKQFKALRAKAEDSKTWTQTGPTSFAPHFQRCNSYADNAGRIGVISV